MVKDSGAEKRSIIDDIIQYYSGEGGARVLELKDVVVIKPYRGGPTLWRMLNWNLKTNISFTALKVELAKGRSIYILPLNAFRKIHVHIASYWGSGRNMIMVVKEGHLVVSKNAVRELKVEVKEEESEWGPWTERRIYVDGKEQLAPFKKSSSERYSTGIELSEERSIANTER